MSTEPMAVVQRLYEAVNRGDVDAVPDIFAPDFYSHPLNQTGIEPIRTAWRMLLDRFPGLRVVPQEMIAAGDRVAVWATIDTVPGASADDPPKMMELIRVADGRVAEVWGVSTLQWRS